ncbi:MAG TPA: hypothetical protein PLQ49_00140 [Methanothrix sp.]|nr:hypothetical protein [Methanothrix sp.]HRW82041.1 hypothetical protein [Methanothrix sp.]
MINARSRPPQLEVYVFSYKAKPDPRIDEQVEEYDQQKSAKFAII